MGIEVVIQGLTKSFGRQNIWQDVTLTLPAGEVSVMLGPSGTGKTVFLKSIIGLLKPEHGQVLVDGVDMANSPERDIYEARKKFGLMFQDGALFGSMSLFDNIAFPLREHTRKKESEIRRIVMERMDMVGLVGAETKMPGEISGGMRKRAGLARALALDPEILFLDEPTAGLDPKQIIETRQLIKELGGDHTVILSTHILPEGEAVCDRVRHQLLCYRNLILFKKTPPEVDSVSFQKRVRHSPADEQCVESG
jgi:phospholipid/cholesterol/gamma-HCH transport system ATP-binding protein